MNTDNSVTLCMLANCGQSYRGIMLVIITRILFFLARGMEILSTKAEKQ